MIWTNHNIAFLKNWTLKELSTSQFEPITVQYCKAWISGRLGPAFPHCGVGLAPASLVSKHRYSHLVKWWHTHRDSVIILDKEITSLQTFKLSHFLTSNFKLCNLWQQGEFRRETCTLNFLTILGKQSCKKFLMGDLPPSTPMVCDNKGQLYVSCLVSLCEITSVPNGEIGLDPAILRCPTSSNF